MFNIKKPTPLSEQHQELNRLKDELKECEWLIKRNEMLFDLTVDDALIEARIYEKNSLAKHRQYLLQSIKKLMEHEKETVDIT